MPIFWPTSKPSALVTGRLVEPAGIVSQGPVETGIKTVVMAVAAVPTLAIVRVSPSISIFWPASKPLVLRTLMVVAPGLAGAASPELARPEQVEAVSRELRPGRDRRELDGCPLALAC